MSRTSNTPATTTLESPSAQMPHGTRWVLDSPGRPALVVRAYRDTATPEKLRVVDQASKRPLLKVTNRDGSTVLPPTAVVQDLLRWADPRLAHPTIDGLERRCWRLTQTPTAFTLSLSARGLAPDAMPELVLSSRGPVGTQRAACANAVRTLLALARGANASTPTTAASPAHLAALARAVNVG